MTRLTVNSTSSRTDLANIISYSELSKVFPLDIITECRKLFILSKAFFLGLPSTGGLLTSAGRFWKALVKSVSSGHMYVREREAREWTGRGRGEKMERELTERGKEREEREQTVRGEEEERRGEERRMSEEPTS